jgi:hypothetical protein
VSKHTPGPWEFNLSLLKDARIYIPSLDGFIFLRTECIDPVKFDMAANARLVAASPELLNEVINAKQVISAVIDHMRTGEPWSETMIEDLESEILGMNLKIAKATGGEDANARLIAAAPEMLLELKTMVSYYRASLPQQAINEGVEPEVQFLLSAEKLIAKATGGT